MSIPPPDPWYVSGFAEGEGIFTYSRNRLQLMVVFAIRLPATDHNLLEGIRDFFGGIGRIYSAPRRAPARGGAGTKASCYYRVTRPAELVRIVNHFDEYPLRGEKREVYEVWREMVFVRAAYHGSSAPVELHELAEKLSGRVPRNRPRAE